MHHWDIDTSGRLQRISTPVEQGCEISVHSDQMDPLPEEQQSQQGTPMNPTTYRLMRDHIHPPRVSAPSCIIPPAEDVAIRPYLVPLLPTFHGMENENPYTHIRDFEEVCITFKEGTIDMDLLKLKAFPLTLKDKAKIWLNSLRPRTIRSWAELQAQFLKKFFSAHKTNNLKRQIYTFAALDNERFYQCWERFIDHQCLSTSWFQHLDACKPLLWWYVSSHEAAIGNCHAPIPGPTRMADPNRFPGRETHDWDSLPEFFFLN